MLNFSFRKLYIPIGKITYFSLHICFWLINVIDTNLFVSYAMKNFDLEEINNLISDPVDSYFECISSCDITDGICISKCIEILKDQGNWKINFTNFLYL